MVEKEMETKPAAQTPPMGETVRIDEKKLRQGLVGLLVQRVITTETEGVPTGDGKPGSRPGSLLVLPRKAPYLIKLENPTAETAITLGVLGSLVIGVAGGDAPPDVDLAEYNAAAKGVSHRHALIRPTGDHLYVIDLNSTNGTRINGDVLKPGQERVLAHNDLISFGALNFMLKILATPAEFELVREAAKPAENGKAP